MGDDGAVVFEKARIITEENKVMKSVFCRAYAAMKIAHINLDRELKQRYAEMKATNQAANGRLRILERKRRVAVFIGIGRSYVGQNMQAFGRR